MLNVIQVLKDVTLLFSSEQPLISSVIPAMDVIDESFATGVINKHDLSPPLRHALGLGKRMLNKYYSLSDASHIYRIAMGMFYTRDSFCMLTFS